MPHSSRTQLSEWIEACSGGFPVFCTTPQPIFATAVLSRQPLYSQGMLLPLCVPKGDAAALRLTQHQGEIQGKPG